MQKGSVELGHELLVIFVLVISLETLVAREVNYMKKMVMFIT